MSMQTAGTFWSSVKKSQLIDCSAVFHGFEVLAFARKWDRKGDFLAFSVPFCRGF